MDVTTLDQALIWLDGRLWTVGETRRVRVCQRFGTASLTIAEMRGRLGWT